ncbi:MAG: ABC transporter substrate-binding protein, partial [Oscillospiraceae bacterium]
SVGEESGEIPYTCYYATKDYIAKNPQTIQKFTNAIAKGQTWVKEHSAEEVATCMLGFFPDTNKEILTKVTQRHKDIDAFMETPVLKEEAFARLQEVMLKAGVIKEKADFSKIVDNSFAEKVK